MQENIYAHSNQDQDPQDYQLLQDHANNVAALASQFASEFGCAHWGDALGKLHDAGKSSSAFQRRLQGSAIKVNHSTAGAKIAIDRYKVWGVLMGYALCGHHGGMPNGIAWSQSPDSAGLHYRTPLESRVKENIEPYDAFFDLAEEGSISLPLESEIEVPCFTRRTTFADERIRIANISFATCFFGRMLYSCLVDADYLDTEAYMSPDAALCRDTTRFSDVNELSEILDAHMFSLMKDAGHTVVNDARRSIYDCCVRAAKLPPGIFTLTVPTGGGKTLSSVAFALKHALVHGMERVIVAIPYTSIVEQTASTFKQIFGVENVLEHHSNYDFDDLDDEEKAKQRLAIQNWDAPIVVTTNVQLFESLFANRPGKCRKIHNIARSVIVLDEAQTLPDPLLKPSLAALEELTRGYGTSVVLCTATQPALSDEWPFGSCPTEIVTNRDGFDGAFGHRVNYEMLGSLSEEDIVDQLARQDQTLCVVGTRKEAHRLYEDMIQAARERGELEPEEDPGIAGYFHLSSYMVPDHRSAKIAAIKMRLENEQRCIVISTQLIEAGVDVDFPVVYREMAGIDSIIQAAGRCNREGHLNSGTVRVFDCLIDGELAKTDPWLEKMKGIGRDVIKGNGNRIDEGLIKPFFEKRYCTSDLDAKGVYQELSSSGIVKSQFWTIPFEQCALDYRFIKDDTVPVFVPWGKDGRHLLEKLLGTDTPTAYTVQLQRFSVGVSKFNIQKYINSGAVKPVPDSPFYVLNVDDGCVVHYSEDVGLLEPGEEVLLNLVG